ncbi:MAG: hypothetical protein ACRDS0_08015 [Pseudonocardiaceae bacterium]
MITGSTIAAAARVPTSAVLSGGEVPGEPRRVAGPGREGDTPPAAGTESVPARRGYRHHATPPLITINPTTAPDHTQLTVTAPVQNLARRSADDTDPV